MCVNVCLANARVGESERERARERGREREGESEACDKQSGSVCISSSKVVADPQSL